MVCIFLNKYSSIKNEVNLSIGVCVLNFFFGIIEDLYLNIEELDVSIEVDLYGLDFFIFFKFF